ncbi:ATP-binding protein [uncultured Fibrella sp.]|uniref:ATP-binding protein n=1 Tax=uncultured Fibrella sp. TaxID=1284596 RepID=UPI0035CB26CD
MVTIDYLKHARESEDHVEFKEAKGGSYSYNGGSKLTPRDRRHCILGYVVALANEGGGRLVLGMADKYPHLVVGTSQCLDGCGKLEQDIYNDLRIRVDVFELYENEKRVLVIEIPSRPTAKIYKFEDVPLMRVGDELLPMSDEQYLKIIQEQEPDFSQKINQDLSISDLDVLAIRAMKDYYSEKNNNQLFLTLPDSQALRDLKLITESGEITNAALILVGKKESIQKHLPQSGIFLEYRNVVGQITFDNRDFFQGPYFLIIDDIWDRINARNGKVPVQQGPFIKFDIPFFNKEVIREAVNNAIAHRDYRKNSEVVIKQYPYQLIITNPGGFPPGVNLENIITVASTPRNRRLTDVMARTGIVERSGQGVDKIFYQCLSEAKSVPDYTQSDDFQVELKLSAVVEDKAFALFINHIQEDRNDGDRERLSVQEIIVLNQVRKGVHKDLISRHIANKLLNDGLIEKIGNTSRQFYRLPKAYYVFINKEGEYTNAATVDETHATMLIMKHFESFNQASMGDFVSFLGRFMSREQIKRLVYTLVKQGQLEQLKAQRGTKYIISERAIAGRKVINRAIDIGLEEMRKRGEIG